MINGNGRKFLSVPANKKEYSFYLSLDIDLRKLSTKSLILENPFFIIECKDEA
jgi:hypothetical protein